MGRLVKTNDNNTAFRIKGYEIFLQLYLSIKDIVDTYDYKYGDDEFIFKYIKIPKRNTEINGLVDIFF